MYSQLKIWSLLVIAIPDDIYAQGKGNERYYL